MEDPKKKYYLVEANEDDVLKTGKDEPYGIVNAKSIKEVEINKFNEVTFINPDDDDQMEYKGD